MAHLIKGHIKPLIYLSLCCLLLFYPPLSCADIGKEGIQTYQKNVHLYEKRKQHLADAVSRYRNADNLWDALRDNFSMYHYESHPMVQQKIEWYMNNQDFLLRSASRAGPYLYYILQQVKQRNMPAELALLPIIESGYNPFAISSAGATGLWQMMPQTAKGLGIRQDRWYDGRRDIIASTRGALNYLAYLQSFFDGNWMLAIAAYNTGEGNVLAAIRRNIRAGKDTSFWSLPLAQQTKDYVPQLLALATIISNPNRYPIYLPPVRNAQYLAQVDIGKQINLKKVAKYAGISYSKLKQLNPGYNHVVTSRGPYKIILPIENVEQFSENYLRFTPSSGPIHWVHYSVQQGDTLSSIAKRFNTSIHTLRKMNRMSKDTVLLGSTILIPEHDTPTPVTKRVQQQSHPLAANQTQLQQQTLKPTMAQATKNARNLANKAVDAAKNALRTHSEHQTLINPGDTIYMVKKNDTLATIAKHFHVKADSIIGKNGLPSATVQAGQQLIIPTGTTREALNKKSTIARIKNLRPGDTIYMVRPGDTLSGIAGRFHLSTADIKTANAKSLHQLNVGEQIILPTHQHG